MVRGEALSISAGWARSWWKREGGRLAGWNHALFRHHSDGARPLGQNTQKVLLHSWRAHAGTGFASAGSLTKFQPVAGRGKWCHRRTFAGAELLPRGDLSKGPDDPIKCKAVLLKQYIQGSRRHQKRFKPRPFQLKCCKRVLNGRTRPQRTRW